MMFIPLTTQVTLYNLVSNEIGSKRTKQLFFNQGYQHINRILTGFANQFDLSKMDVHTFMQLFTPTAQTLGLGRIEHEAPNLFEGHGIVKLSANSFAKTYLQLYGKQELGVDDFVRGILVGFVDLVAKKQTRCIETKCIAKGDPSCEFVIKPLRKT